MNSDSLLFPARKMTPKPDNEQWYCCQSRGSPDGGLYKLQVGLAGVHSHILEHGRRECQQLLSFLRTARLSAIEFGHLVPLSQQNSAQKARTWWSYVEVERKRMEKKKRDSSDGEVLGVYKFYYGGDGGGTWYELEQAQFDEANENDFARKAMPGDVLPDAQKQYCTMSLEPCKHKAYNKDPDDENPDEMDPDGSGIYEEISITIHWHLPLQKKEYGRN